MQDESFTHLMRGFIANGWLLGLHQYSLTTVRSARFLDDVTVVLDWDWFVSIFFRSVANFFKALERKYDRCFDFGTGKRNIVLIWRKRT